MSNLMDRWDNPEYTGFQNNLVFTQSEGNGREAQALFRTSVPQP